MITLIQYLQSTQCADSCCNLTTDLQHWAECGVTTAEQLMDYLDAEFEANMRKEQW